MKEKKAIGAESLKKTVSLQCVENTSLKFFTEMDAHRYAAAIRLANMKK